MARILKFPTFADLSVNRLGGDRAKLKSEIEDLKPGQQFFDRSTPPKFPVSIKDTPETRELRSKLNFERAIEEQLGVDFSELKLDPNTRGPKRPTDLN